MPLHRKIRSLFLGRGWPGHVPGESHFDRIPVEHRILERVRSVTDADVPDGDVVIATYYPTVFGVSRLSPSKGAKVFFIQNYELASGTANPRLDATWRSPLHKVVISKWLDELAKTKFADPMVSHVPNSVDTKQFYSPLRQKNSIPMVGLLYATSWMKGCRHSFAALEKVAAELPDLRIICFGAEKPGRDLPLPPNAEFHLRPPQERIRELYARCDLWRCGSEREGFHLPPLEAMACRCPVVSTRVGGPVDIIREGVNGHLVGIGDVDLLAKRALQVLSLPGDQWKRMSDAAFETAIRYSWEDATDLFEDALELAIERTRRGELCRQESAWAQESKTVETAFKGRL